MCIFSTVYSPKQQPDVGLTLSQTSPDFSVSAVYFFWKHCGKRKNCALRAISPFPLVLSFLLENFPPFSSNLQLSLANSFSLEESKIYHLGKGSCVYCLFFICKKQRNDVGLNNNDNNYYYIYHYY